MFTGSSYACVFGNHGVLTNFLAPFSSGLLCRCVQSFVETFNNTLRNTAIYTLKGISTANLQEPGCPATPTEELGA